MFDEEQSILRLAAFRAKVQSMSTQQLLELAMQLKQATQHLSDALQIISARLEADKQKKNRGN